MFSMLAFNYAEEYAVNAGVAGVLIPMSGILVGITSYFFYGEKLKVTQIIGILTIIAGAIIISLFPAEAASSGERTTSLQVAAVIGLGLAAATCLSIEFMISKHLSKQGVDGRYLGFNFLLCEGVVGTLCLLGATAMGEGIQLLDW